jgi:hypothetical protein
MAGPHAKALSAKTICSTNTATKDTTILKANIIKPGPSFYTKHSHDKQDAEANSKFKIICKIMIFLWM